MTGAELTEGKIYRRSILYCNAGMHTKNIKAMPRPNGQKSLAAGVLFYTLGFRKKLVGPNAHFTRSVCGPMECSIT